MCENCKYCFCDYSVNDFECTCDRITEDLLDRHFTDGKPGCPYYTERMTAAQAEAENRYFESLLAE